MSKKLNLELSNNNMEIVKDFLDLMHIYKLDYTNTFIELEKNKLDKNIFNNWLSKYSLRKSKKYKNINPFIIPRNHIIENIINDSYNKNFLNLINFNKILKKPYEENIKNKEYTKKAEEHEKVHQTFCGT